MKFNWYLSVILLSLLAPKLALSQEIENSSNNKSFDIVNLDLSNSKAEETKKTTSEDNISNTTPEKKEPNPSEISNTETTTVAPDSCESTPPKVQHPLIPPLEVAENTTEKPENNAELLSLEKPSDIEENSENKEEKEEDFLTISQSEITHYPTLAKADHFYRCGETLLAERFYREAKEPFGNEEELNRLG